ncbi:hypothetical protein CARUB_v10021817mg [Capsella rubella]|uniref:Uncharacterized protein n=1 Tax=Capsella rubella TaxID=81985 RepID=R0I9U9_9BRAS|nr:hypothetical protein CARUB_v10021817mg [Capsella rubella]
MKNYYPPQVVIAGDLQKKQGIKGREPEILANKRGGKLLEELIECCNGKSNPIKFFFADEILKAFNNFSWSNRISRVYGWYSCKNENHSKKTGQEVLYILDENNICRDIAVGCCLELEDRVLVLDGVKKHYNLDISTEPWKRRMNITEDIVTIVAYLHTAFPRPFVYMSMSLVKGETYVHVDDTLDVEFFGYLIYDNPKYGIL